MDTTIGIIVAMPEEMIHLKNIFPGLKLIISTPFETYQLDNKKVYFMVSGIGKVNAAVACTLLITQYRVSIILNIGTSGALNNKLSVGDVIFSNKAIYFDVDNRISGHQFGQLPNMPLHYTSSLLPDLASDYFVATGDSFITDSKQLIKQLGDVIKAPFLIDMESAAVAQTCYHFNIPFFMIKGVSDIINSDSLTESRANRLMVMENIAKSTQLILDRILKATAQPCPVVLELDLRNG